ncbi:hypothetical protein DdX_15559 [Ditylenchus destructor]|uniref:Uncharacterized protein n=1 Tax=Ditylenchus destructor TaxID=166010 RepID=A0AAD4MUR3_9BILA|nr:hypothetical protein DdX_15559 [Ditylenchus destructor]
MFRTKGNALVGVVLERSKFSKCLNAKERSNCLLSCDLYNRAVIMDERLSNMDLMERRPMAMEVNMVAPRLNPVTGHLESVYLDWGMLQVLTGPVLLLVDSCL